MPRKKPTRKPETWHEFDVRLRNGVWVAVFQHPDPNAVRSRTKNGVTYHERKEVLRTLKDADGKQPAAGDAGAAYGLGQRVYEWLEKERILVRERGPAVEQTLSEGERVLWPMEAAIDDWLARPKAHRTQVSNRGRIRPFREWIAAQGKTTLNELTFSDAREFHAHVGERELADAGRNKLWFAVIQFLNWCCSAKVNRLKANPFLEQKLEGFVSKSARDRELPDSASIVHRKQRAALLAACRTTSERLLLHLYNLAGLRPSEPYFLRWSHWLRRPDSNELVLRHCPERNYKVKTGERIVPLLYEEIVTLLEHHRNTTSTGNGPDDWIFAAEPGVPYEAAPRRWIERLQSETKTDWTPVVGRHTACSLFPLMSERLTGRRWSEVEHEKIFGHDAQTARDYYITEHLADLAKHEGLAVSPSKNAGEVAAEFDVEPRGGLTVDLAKQLLSRLMIRSRLSVAAAISVSETAIRKWQRSGKSLPSWYWPAIECLLAK